MRQHFFKFTLIIFLIIIFYGCTDSRYLSEKLFWQAEREASKILKKGRKNLDETDYRKLIAIYRKVSDNCPLQELGAKSQFIITQFYILQGKYKEAQRELTQIINNFSSKPEIASRAQFAIGRLYESQGKWEKALKEYEKIMDLYPLTPVGLNMPLYFLRYYRNINDAQEEDKSYRQGIRYYYKLINEFAETQVIPVVKDYLAFLHLAKGEWQKAIKVWDEIIDEYPESAQAIKAFLLKAETYLNKTKDLSRAINVYREFLNRYPKHKLSGEVKIKLAKSYYSNSQIEDAKKTYLEIIKDYSQNPTLTLQAYIGLSYCYREEADTQKVMEIYNKIKNNYPETKQALSIPFLVAQYYQQIKYASKAERAFKDAIKEYKRVLQDDKKKPWMKREAENFLALCYIKTKKWDKALFLLRSLADRYPKNPIYLLDLASVYRNLNAVDKAIDVYQELINRYPNNEFIVNLSRSQITSLKEDVSQ
ncbi:MAG: hypothetical protein DRP68_01685 [Candidatus Omnitrophota bacterium]|nr:MAG: hypothetical protein DRP68_01685 [Candidatus Omnitrophota bacterium]RKY36121.1 MAG: hypothetical protein DRP72_04450 [Candidatus Omnitrophota bacterium]